MTFSTVGSFDYGQKLFKNEELPGEYQTASITVDARDYVQSFTMQHKQGKSAQYPLEKQHALELFPTKLIKEMVTLRIIS